ncbi:membrane-targeted effector domain-containing toxin [Pseudomonas sp. REP124]|uniref:membrane-targeted effector domain-containing toxin n=1 Tax=Pseudomonas sp. REP124 TaxID=2875731 RepID=UPI001CC93BBC|nr:membrane-targeted effector domain-containing toxin [Pseudomonas sp. REP124]MBZ9781171.1 membrane-targeted effector domain-containing toxin [Pseudomonas sp. REP124]
MEPTSPHPLPNAADKAALKAIATNLINACPSLHDTAHGIAADLLKKYGVVGLDPDQVYFHRFKTAQSLAPSFTGWQHYAEKPYESQTLTQLVIHRFRATDQDNADLLDLYGGFYTADPDAENFDASNEVRLHGNDVLKDFWKIDFSTLYRSKLQAFWSDYSSDFRTLAKCSFLSKAIEARDSGQLSDADFQTAVSAVIGPLTWPISLHTLHSETPVGVDLKVFALDVAGHVATDILRIIDPSGRQILYVPGDVEAFHVMETAAAMHWWILDQLNERAPRQLFLKHFPLADQQQITEGITDLMNRLVSTWGHSDHHLINQKNLSVTGDAFTWLRDRTRAAMSAEADLSLTSNGDLRKKLWIGYLSAGLKVFGPMAAVGWPVALPVIGASLASMGLNIDQAVNGKTSAERKAGVIGAILSGIDLLFNLPFLKGSGSLAEVGAELEAAEAAEWADLKPEPPELSNEISPVPEEPPAPATSDIPQKYQSNELLAWYKPGTEPGKFQGIYRLAGDPPYAISMNNRAYYVRYFTDSQGGGFWAIVDPVRPNQLIHSIPVRLNAQGNWERMPRLGLKGGGLCQGKQCAVDIELDERLPEPAPESSASPSPEPQPGDIHLVKTHYDVDPALRTELRKWALQLNETHVQVQLGPNGNLIPVDRYGPNFASKARALVGAAGRFYQLMSWRSLPLRPAIPAVSPSTTFPELISLIFKEAPGMVLAETPGRITSMRLLIENMPGLAREGVRTLYVRRLLNDFAQIDLNAYFESGVMSKDLREYLTSLGTDPAGRFNELELVKAARENGIRVQATDCAATYRKPMPFLRSEEQMSTNHLTANIMFMDRTLNGAGKWVAVTGVENTNVFRGMAGVSELEGGIGVRIEEVSPGQGERISPDPGIEIKRGPVQQPNPMRGTFDPFHADLLVRAEAPAVIRDELQTSKLLYRPGMYVFEGAQGDYTLVHRSQTNMLVRTPVRTSAAGQLYIVRPSWGEQVSDVRFGNLQQLSEALESRGLSLQSRLPD